MKYVRFSLFLGFLSIKTLKESDLTIGKMLGKGSFGAVFECHLSSNDTMKFAIKFIKTKDMKTPIYEDTMYEIEELYNMDRLANTHIVQYYG